MLESFVELDRDAEPVWPFCAQEESSQGFRRIAIAVAVGVAFGLLIGLGGLLRHDVGHFAIATFRPADGVLAAFLLLHPRGRWWAWVLAAWLGNAISVHLMGDSLWMSGYIAFCNITEIVMAVLLWKRAIERSQRNSRKDPPNTLPDLASPAIMLQFVFFAVLLAPAASALMGSAGMHVAYGSRFWPIARIWFPAHALGMAVMTPLTLAVWHPNLRKLFDRAHVLSSASMLLMLLVVSIAIFSQTTGYPLLFLFLPPLMLVVFRMGILGGVLGTFEILVVAALFTLHAHGPFWMGKDANIQASVLLLQASILVLMVSVIPFAVTLERLDHSRKQLRDGMKLYRLLADNSHDIVMLSSLEGHRLYVSPAVRATLGWTQEEWVDKDSVDFLHPDDIGPFRRMLQEMLHGKDRCKFRYRTRHKDGQYLWMEANLRMLREEATGVPYAYVATIRDISQRVEAEQELEAAYRQVQELAQHDSLTGLANRRRFDEGLDAEWRRGYRTVHPLALLMVDIDHFKSINDTYGHRAGDYCLQAIAATLRQIGRRPGDVVARYGGEEFALLLPKVEIATALVMAEELCMKVRELKIEAGIGHVLNLTVSVGVAVLMPDKSARADVLVEAADRGLYAAKQAGRNRVMTGGVQKIAAASTHHVH
ncbi:MAG: sensor domain-containing diguanylate cyclase [Acidobacteriaceae bacterium]